MKIFQSLLASTMCCSSLFAAPLELGSPFSEHMVLQRECDVPVWGWGTPGKKVTVSIKGVKAETTVGKDSHWMLQLAPLPTGGPYTFKVTSANEKINFSDVLVGEVWICSGQSNMEFNSKKMKGVEAITSDFKGRAIRCMTVTQNVSFKPAERCGGKWTTSPSNSAVALGFSYNLQKALDVPVGVIVTCWGSSSIEGWMPLDMTKQLPHFKKEMEMFHEKDQKKVEQLIANQKKGKKWAIKENIYLRTRPNILYNAMMAPIAPFASRGMIWYQGEANAKNMANMQQYGTSLPLWCQRLRKQWNNDKFHLLAVMLPRFDRMIGKKAEVTAPGTQSWAWMRESQLNLLNTPHTGVANTIDLGEHKNIHPRDKMPIGHRLSLLAQSDVYKKEVEAQGPTYDGKAIVKNGTIKLTFTHAKGLSTSDGKPPRSFWIAGDDKKWVSATATIQNSQTIELKSSSCPQPKYVRYAFAAFPDVNLINAAKLPAMPFRTDSFKP